MKIEKYKGNFPLWITPTQVIIIPEYDEYIEFAKNIEDSLLKNGIRVKIDNSEASLQIRKNKAIDLKIPYILTIGKNEFNNKTINVKIKD